MIKPIFKTMCFKNNKFGNKEEEESMSFAEILLAVFFPPISVLLRYGLTGKFWLNILFTLIGWLPGVVHAFIVLSKEQRLTRA